jgi:hypothetical protein
MRSARSRHRDVQWHERVDGITQAQHEHFTCVDDKRDHARGDEQRNENRHDRVKAGSAIKLEDRRHDHTNGVLSVCPTNQISVSKWKGEEKREKRDYPPP